MRPGATIGLRQRVWGIAHIFAGRTAKMRIGVDAVSDRFIVQSLLSLGVVVCPYSVKG